MFASCRFAVIVLFSGIAVAQEPAVKPAPFALQTGDRIAWMGSSSTKIGVWPKTMEFLLRTQQPQLQLEFRRYTTGGGTFDTGLQNFDKWLADGFKPTLIVFNYGGNDAAADAKGLPVFRERMSAIVAKAKAVNARVAFTSPQAADVRKAGEVPAARRKVYSDALLQYADEHHWPAFDVFTPLDALQKAGQADDDAFTILKDSIHLNDPAYIAWGCFLYEQMKLPAAESSAELTASAAVTKATGCTVTDVTASATGLRFTRLDRVVPILPPVALPSAKHVPLERLSAYRLKVTGLKEGIYHIKVDDTVLGDATAKELADGINVNRFQLATGKPTPWQADAKDWWDGKSLDRIGTVARQWTLTREP